jgi:hypothetical protein
MLFSQLLEIQYSNYDISAKKMFTIPPPCQPPELDGLRPRPHCRPDPQSSAQSIKSTLLSLHRMG